MTDEQLIDHFAGLAMQALISTNSLYSDWANADLAQVANFAYAMSMHMVEHKAELIEGGVI